MLFVDLGTVALRCAIDGEGPLTLVLIHELGGSLESWDELVPLLPDSVKVLRYDMRGAGLSEKLRGAVSFDDMADDLGRLLSRLGVDGPLLLAGAAVGAGVALAFAASSPEHVRGVIAMAPAVSIPADRREAASAFAAEIEARGLRPLMAMAVERAFAAEVATNPERIAAYAARWLGNDARSYAETYRMLIRSTLNERLAAVRAPVLAVAGLYDVVRPAALVRATAAALPRAEYRELPAGHFMAVQSPELVAALVREWIEAQGV